MPDVDEEVWILEEVCPHDGSTLIGVFADDESAKSARAGERWWALPGGAEGLGGWTTAPTPEYTKPYLILNCYPVLSHFVDGVNIAELAALPSDMDANTNNVVVLAEHRQSWDGPAVFGPYTTAAVAMADVLEKYRDGEFDPHGCTVDYKAAQQ